MMLAFAVIMLAMVYLSVRLVFFIISDYLWYEKVIAFCLLMAELFILVHGMGYFREIYQVTKAGGEKPSQDLSYDQPSVWPPVAVIVSSYHEPLHVVEDTLISFYNLTYPNKYLYFLDDTRYDLPGSDPEEMQAYREAIDDLVKRIGINLFRRSWRGAKAGMINDFLAFLAGERREGFEFQQNWKGGGPADEKYIIVFDADQNPFPGFIKPLVARMETEDRLAFIQTPQYYTNFEDNLIAKASGLQQSVFYEYICEGKSLSDAMFCCGTNVIFRREALMDVEGFDESSVTEDFATSLKFHLKGWGSAYRGAPMAFGMGPEDLGGYFKQQFRWALGTVGLLRSIIPIFLSRPKNMAPVKWWEYFLSGTHYFIGLVFLTLVICPMLYIFFNVPSYFVKPEIYVLVFVPYFFLTMYTFLWTLKSRHYRARDLFLGQLLMVNTFPVYIKASLSALLGIKGHFVTTPKGGSTVLPLSALWPQLTLMILCLIAFVWGMNRLVFEKDPLVGILVNSLWCLYHFFILSFVLYLNDPQGWRWRRAR